MAELDYGYDLAGNMMNASDLWSGGKFPKGKAISYEDYVKIWKSKHGHSRTGALAAYRRLHGDPNFNKRIISQPQITRMRGTSSQVEKLQQELLECREELAIALTENDKLKSLLEQQKARFINYNMNA